jgi:hypothetical protein
MDICITTLYEVALTGLANSPQEVIYILIGLFNGACSAQTIPLNCGMIFIWSKVRTVMVKVALEQAMKTQRYSGTFFNLCARWGWVVNATRRPLCPQERDPISIA